MMQQINLLQNRSVFPTVVAFVVPKTTPSASGSYGRQASRQTKVLLFQEIFKSYNLTSNALFGYFQTTSCCTNRLTALVFQTMIITRLVLQAHFWEAILFLINLYY